MKKFLKDTRGVVMMEYIILGCFAVAITLVAVLALGKVYNNGLATMGFATLGASSAAVEANTTAATNFVADLGEASAYAGELAQGGQASSVVTFDVYAAASAGTTTPTPSPAP